MKRFFVLFLTLTSLTFFSCQPDPDSPENAQMTMEQLTAHLSANPDFKQAALQIRSNEQQINEDFIGTLSETELEILLEVQTNYGGLIEGSEHGTATEQATVERLYNQLDLKAPGTFALALASLEDKNFNRADLPQAMANATAMLSPQLAVNSPCGGLCDNVYMTRYYVDYTDIYSRTGNYEWADLQASRSASSARWGCMVACIELLSPE